MTKQNINRRKFLGGAASAVGATAVFSIVPRRVLGGPGYTPPSEELTKAVIGVGGMGQSHLTYGGARLLAVCDVDSNHLKNTLKVCGKDVKGYHDFREVLARPDIDIIHIPTPPHWHALISTAAADAGKDIWCEKPMSRTIGEGKKVIAAVRRNGSMFRINTWFRFTTDSFYGLGSVPRTVKKVVESGMLGWPLKITISKSTGFDWKFNWIGKTNLTPQKIPATLDYDFWLGPAPHRPYNSHRVHKTFRGYWDYDGGGLGDMGQHYLDPAQYILGKDNTSPVAVEAEAPTQHPDAVGRWQRIEMRYADGCQLILDGENRDKKAAFIEGPKGKIFKGFKSNISHFEAKVAQLPEPLPQITDFSESVRTRRKFALNEENGHRSCTLVNLGKIAVRLRRPLHFDPVKQVFINDSVANRLIDQPMRGAWRI